MADYWRGGWANQTEMLPGTRAAAMDKGRYGPWNALADIIGAVWKRNEARAHANAMKDFYSPVNVNTSDVVSTPQFGDMSLQSAIGGREQAQTPAEQAITEAAPLGGAREAALNMADSMQGIGMTGAANAMRNFQGAAPAQFGTGAWYQQNVQPQPAEQAVQPQTPQQVATQQPAPQQGMTAAEVEYQKNLQEHPEWFDLDGNYIGNTFTMYDGVSDSNLDPLTLRKLNLLSSDFQNRWGEPLGATSMRRHGDGSSWHDSGQAFDVAGGILETNPEARAWAVNQAAKYGLVPLDEYANPSPHATGGHLHFSDHGDALTNNYEQGGSQGHESQPAQRGGAIQLPQTQRYRPEQRQLHQATAEQPWVDRYNSRERVLSAFDDAWAKKMDALAKAYPEMLNDRSFMQQAIAMREQGRNQLLDEWQGTQTKRNWDEFQTALANNDYNKALFFGYKNGLDPNAMKALMSPDYETKLMDFGGGKRVVSQNRYTGDILVNGNTPTEADLTDMISAYQQAQLDLANRQQDLREREFTYRQNADAERRTSGGRASAGSSDGTSSRSRTSSAADPTQKDDDYIIKRQAQWEKEHPNNHPTDSPFYQDAKEAWKRRDIAHGLEPSEPEGASYDDAYNDILEIVKSSEYAMNPDKNAADTDMENMIISAYGDMGRQALTDYYTNRKGA